ncbi:hypothetical protein GN316_19500 [Xylophilus sp. Kf1]|nr:hypothetical protein [Xylophilus sp. Kf1]
MNRIALRHRATTLAASGFLLAGCNSVIPASGGAAASATTATDSVTIEHSSLRSRISVYESALKACKQRGHEQAVFQTQVNEDAQKPPATGPQLSSFACRS